MHPQAKQQKKHQAKAPTQRKKQKPTPNRNTFALLCTPKMTTHKKRWKTIVNGNSAIFPKMKLPSASQSDAWKLVTGYPVRKF